MIPRKTRPLDNPVIEMLPSDFTNDPMVVARNDNMIAIAHLKFRDDLREAAKKRRYL